MTPRKLFRAGIGTKRKYKNVNSSIPKSLAFFYKPDISAHPLSSILDLSHKKQWESLQLCQQINWRQALCFPDSILMFRTSAPRQVLPAGPALCSWNPPGSPSNPATPSQRLWDPIPSTTQGAAGDRISQEHPAGFVPSRKNAQQVPLGPLQLSGRCEQNFLNYLNRTSWQFTGSTEERKGFGKRQQENNSTATCRNYSVPVVCV